MDGLDAPRLTGTLGVASNVALPEQAGTMHLARDTVMRGR